ncbi:hypothetical protein CHARACLAT_021336 [Characodon lateralis]|uniref:CCZ1/INTU/HSP4 first Longin domain-containing protein n=1 Tax=Characodon lateralis TaxID=208331 RepID=A0ABU7DIL1_9TELE|nr:hypothetical protein [Characodon lateralis]
MSVCKSLENSIPAKFALFFQTEGTLTSAGNTLTTDENTTKPHLKYKHIFIYESRNEGMVKEFDVSMFKFIPDHEVGVFVCINQLIKSINHLYFYIQRYFTQTLSALV